MRAKRTMATMTAIRATTLMKRTVLWTRWLPPRKEILNKSHNNYGRFPSLWMMMMMVMMLLGMMTMMVVMIMMIVMLAMLVMLVGRVGHSLHTVNRCLHRSQEWGLIRILMDLVALMRVLLDLMMIFDCK